MNKDQPFKLMNINDVIKLPYELAMQKYAHVYGDKTGKVFRTKQEPKGTLIITRKL